MWNRPSIASLPCTHLGYVVRLDPVAAASAGGWDVFESDGSLTDRYRFISEHHAVYGVARLCRVLAVQRRQGYTNEVATRPPRPPQRAQAGGRPRR